MSTPTTVAAVPKLRALKLRSVLTLLTFGAGIYTGMYISQNYEVPRVDEPGKLIDKIKEYADEQRKNANGSAGTKKE